LNPVPRRQERRLQEAVLGSARRCKRSSKGKDSRRGQVRQQGSRWTTGIGQLLLHPVPHEIHPCVQAVRIGPATAILPDSGRHDTCPNRAAGPSRAQRVQEHRSRRFGSCKGTLRFRCSPICTLCRFPVAASSISTTRGPPESAVQESRPTSPAQK
jgi:hypothetical protein